MYKIVIPKSKHRNRWTEEEIPFAIKHKNEYKYHNFKSLCESGGGVELVSHPIITQNFWRFYENQIPNTGSKYLNVPVALSFPLSWEFYYPKIESFPYKLGDTVANRDKNNCLHVGTFIAVDNDTTPLFINFNSGIFKLMTYQTLIRNNCGLQVVRPIYPKVFSNSMDACYGEFLRFHCDFFTNGKCLL